MINDDFLNEIKQKSLFCALFLIEKNVFSLNSNLGTDFLPDNELINLSSHYKLGYEYFECCDFHPINNKINVNFNLISLIGEKGVLPSHYNELVIQRVKNNDHVLKDFLDIFNHRLVSLYYRAWKLYESPIHYEELINFNSSLINDVLNSLTGSESFLSTEFGGFFSKSIRSRSASQSFLEYFSNCKVNIFDFKGKWANIDDLEQTRLCSKQNIEGQYSQLGYGAVIGKKFWDINSGITIEFNADNCIKVGKLLPHSEYLNTIKNNYLEMMGKTKSINWKLKSNHSLLPKAKLTKKGCSLGTGAILPLHRNTQDRIVTINI